ncbi:MAG TPA: DUF4232 domain-containing protein [Acidimicrobiales bacterium]|nr:DUF4232 domain-containing protein [Acidimicrobiales bacterium]
MRKVRARFPCRPVAAVTVAGMALVLAACGGGGGSATTTTTTTTASGGTSSTTATTAGTTTTAASGTPTACAARALAMSVSGTEGAAGTLELTFALRNVSSAACPMDGFPPVQLIDAAGGELQTTVVRGGSYPFTDIAPTAITLAPGETAYFNLGYSDVPTGSESSCPAATQLEVTPPGAADHDTVAVGITACNAGTLTVSPVFAAGSAGARTTAPAAS